MILILLIFLLSSNIYCMETPEKYHSHEDLETGRILDSKKEEEREEKKYDTQELKEIKLEEIFGEISNDLVIDIDDPNLIYRLKSKSIKKNEEEEQKDVNVEYLNFLKEKIKKAIEQKNTPELICLINEVQIVNLKKVNDKNTDQHIKTLKQIKKDQCVLLTQNIALAIVLGFVVTGTNILSKYL